MDTYTVIVSHTAENAAGPVTVSRVLVLGRSTNDATLTALEMVAARGRSPIDAKVDWDNF